MTPTALKETAKQIKGHKVMSVNFKDKTYETEKCVYGFELTKTGLLKTNSIKFLYTIKNYNNCSY